MFKYLLSTFLFEKHWNTKLGLSNSSEKSRTVNDIESELIFLFISSLKYGMSKHYAGVPSMNKLNFTDGFLAAIPRLLSEIYKFTSHISLSRSSILVDLKFEDVAFVDGGKKDPEKSPLSKGRTNNKFNPDMAPGRNRNRAKLAGSEVSHRDWAIPASQRVCLHLWPSVCSVASFVLGRLFALHSLV